MPGLGRHDEVHSIIAALERIPNNPLIVPLLANLRAGAPK